MSYNCAVILAGGEGTRMHSNKPKVMAELLFKPMIDHVLSTAKKAGLSEICVVTGYQRPRAYGAADGTPRHGPRCDAGCGIYQEQRFR